MEVINEEKQAKTNVIQGLSKMDINQLIDLIYKCNQAADKHSLYLADLAKSFLFQAMIVEVEKKSPPKAEIVKCRSLIYRLAIGLSGMKNKIHYVCI